MNWNREVPLSDHERRRIRCSTKAESDVTIDRDELNPGGRTSPKYPAAVCRAGCSDVHHCLMKSGVISHFWRVRLFGRPPRGSHRSQVLYVRPPVRQRLVESCKFAVCNVSSYSSSDISCSSPLGVIVNDLRGMSLIMQNFRTM